MFKELNDSNVIREEDIENDSLRDSIIKVNSPNNNFYGKNNGVDNDSGGSGKKYVNFNGNEGNNDLDDSGSSEDVYNSAPAAGKKLSNKDFRRFFKFPAIIIVLLISAVLFLKYIFSGKQEKAVKNNTVINDKKMFSSSVFDKAAKSNSLQKRNNLDIGNKEKDGYGSTMRHGEGKEFNAKFKKEADKLNLKVKFNSGSGYGNSGYGSNEQTDSEQQITKKTVVFIKASYGKYILDKERGVKKSGFTSLKPGGERESGAFTQKAAYAEIAVPQGTVVNAYTKYKIFSYNTSVPVIAVAVSGYYNGGKEIFGKGAEFFGTVNVKHSLNRLNINFTKIIESSGKSLTIDAIAMMPDGSGGVKGDVHNHYTGNILTSIAQGIVGAASIFVGGGSGVNSSAPYTFQNQVRQNVAQNELNSAENGLNGYAQSNQNISIALPAGTPIKIIFLSPLYMNKI